jgi:hypothetical protein
MFKDNIAWYDVDSDEDFCIPLLPPLPLVEMMSFNDVGAKNEEQSPSVTLSETSEPSSSAAGSRRNSEDDECVRIASDRFRIRFDHVEDTLKSKKMAPNRGCSKRKCSTTLKRKSAPKYVCFFGKFPKVTTTDDLRSFLKSNEINFAGIRLGRKKNPNLTTFGYVDLPTEKDYDKLLALDGSMYGRRKIRIDHATSKENFQDDMLNQTVEQSVTVTHSPKKTQWKKGNQTDGFGSRRGETNTPTLQKAHPVPVVGKKPRLAPLKSRLPLKREGSHKVTARSRRWKKTMYHQNRRSRNNQKYIKSTKASRSPINSNSSSRSRRQAKSGGASKNISASKESGLVWQLPQHVSN